MNVQPVAFIAFRQFDNLGIGYLQSVLKEAGYRSKLIDFALPRQEILKILRRMKPIAVGFSVIFQYHISEFTSLISFLRKKGIKCHFTAGGQYASLRYKELFNLIPELDSIVRFEGEYAIVDLVRSLENGKSWKGIKNIAYKDNGEVMVNPARPPEKNIDIFPFPARAPLSEYMPGLKYATILAGRGCVNNCSFCNVREYYNQAKGPPRRVRNPECIVDEMEFLYRKKDCRIFLFQDDDFPLKNLSDNGWIKTFCSELSKRRLTGKILWKINCRPDEIEYESFAMMKENGLFLVFTGLEDGTEEGLKRMNKNTTPAENLKGIRILKELEIGFDFGFMLFQPSSTFDTVRENIHFLKLITEDGYTPVTFLKMLPFFETEIERELISEGRIKGDPGFYDYDFHDKRLNSYYDFIADLFTHWLSDPEGLLNILRWSRNYILVVSGYNEMSPGMVAVAEKIRSVTASSNRFLLNVMLELADIFESSDHTDGSFEEAEMKRQLIRRRYTHYCNTAKTSMLSFLNLWFLKSYTYEEKEIA